MSPERLVEDYISAWNRQDIEGVLALMHDGAAYYDAFWRETCVGRDLAQYFRASFDDYAYWYQLVGDVIVTDSGVAFRYDALMRSDSENSDAVFSGVEVLTLRNGKILTASNHYFDPRQECILELAELEATRHGESRYANFGLPFHRFLRLKRQYSAAMNQDKVYLDPALTLSQLADQIGCTDDQLLQVMSFDREVDFGDHINRYRARYAGDMLREEPGNKIDFAHIATQAGFRSFEQLCNAFNETFHETPMEFVHRTTTNFESENNSVAH